MSPGGKRGRSWSGTSFGSSSSGPPVARKVKKYVKGCLKRFIDKKVKNISNVVGNGGIPGTAGRMDSLQIYTITQGTTDVTRVGNHIRISRITLRMYLELAAGDATAGYRVILYRDKQTNGAVPAATEIITPASEVTAGYNADNVIRAGGARIQVLRDIYTALNTSTGTTATSIPASTKRAFKVVLKGPFNVHFDSSGGAITDIVSGDLGILTMCTNGTSYVQGSAFIEYEDA